MSTASERRYGPRPENIQRGEAHPRARLTAAQVQEIRSLYKTGSTASSIAHLFGITRWYVVRIVRRERWSHL